MTPVELLALATDKDAAGRAALEAGDATGAAVAFHQAEVCRAAARELERLTGRTDVIHTGGMTTALSSRMGRARAAVAAHNPLLVAIAGSKWGSARNYAAKRLGIAPSSLTNYMRDKPVPAGVAKKVAADFPGIPWAWPKGITE